ncbi:MAG: GNAT family N-acetyltransferase [Oscillospiraceae bacterium]|nr:GNAT family N-acetyltransferase [Oscillospiraceae bacterium]
MYIRLTEKEDLIHVQRLWGDGDVMHYVGFPNGLPVTMEHLETQWLPWVQNFPGRQHYSVYQDPMYCGEAFYDVDELGFACMDIKLLPVARGKGIGTYALSHALDQAFLVGGATVAWVDPDPQNSKALKLYERLGFHPATRPCHLEDPGCDYVYMELKRDTWQARRGIRYRNIILRDLVESDIEDWIRWETADTEWMDWDGPDLEAPPFVEGEFRRECAELLQNPLTGFRNFFELDTIQGKHIGMVTSGLTGEDYEYLTREEIRAGKKAYHTFGIVICESGYWSCGYGTQALTAFCQHFLNSGRTEIRLQTWSGNLRMVSCAQRIGFVEVHRFVGNRHIRGETYDGLTFQLDLDKFHKHLAENP